MNVGLRNLSSETIDLFFTVDGGPSIHTGVTPLFVLFFGGELVTLHGAFANGDTLTVTIGSYATATDCHFITQGTIAKSN